MNYVKHALTLLLITGFASTNAQPLVELKIDGCDIVTPVVKAVGETIEPVTSVIATLCKFLNHIHIPVFFIKTRESNQMAIMWQPLSRFALIGATALGSYYLFTKCDEEMTKKWNSPTEYSNIKECAYGFSGIFAGCTALGLFILLPASDTLTRLPITPLNI